MIVVVVVVVDSIRERKCVELGLLLVRLWMFEESKVCVVIL